MAKCPKCNEDIDYLNFDATGTCLGYLEKGQNCTEAYDLDSLTTGVDFDNFQCPNCDEIIFFTESEAMEFLNSFKMQKEI